MNLVTLLDAHAQARPDQIALIEGSGRSETNLTFAQLARASRCAASWLAHHGLHQGDVVLLFQPMGADLYIALSALFRLGLTAMFVDPSMGLAHLARCCTKLPPQGLLAGPSSHLLRLVSPALARVPLKWSTGRAMPGTLAWRGWTDLEPWPSVTACADEDAALVTCSSGSTGRPKIAVRTHGFLHSQHAVLQRTLHYAAGDVIMTTLPIFALSHLAAGRTVLIPPVDLRRPDRVDPGPLVAHLERHGATCVEGSPALLERVGAHCVRRRQQLAGLTRVHTGGGPVYPDLLDRWQQIAPNAMIHALYGSTEAEPIACAGAGEIVAASRGESTRGGGLPVGRPIGAITLRIVPDRWGVPSGPFSEEEFNRLSLSPGQAGEIVVAGAHVLGGYLHGEGDEETKIAVGNGIWHRTGDAGYLDSAGNLTLLGRCSARMDDGRGVLYPLAVEVAARRHNGVRRAACVALGDRRVLAVEGNGLRSPDLSLLREELSWAAVDEIRHVTHIPVDKRHNAKVDYPALQKVLAPKLLALSPWWRERA